VVKFSMFYGADLHVLSIRMNPAPRQCGALVT
jgi:hypothetical protein